MSGAERTLDSAPGAATLYPRAAFGTFARPLLRKVPLVGGSTPKTLPELTLGLDDVALDAGHVADYARVCGFDLRDTLPASYLHVLGFPLAMSLMTDGAFPFGVIGLVHVANRIEHLRPVALGETPSFRVHAEDLRDHPKGRQFDVVAVATVAGERVWEGRSTYLRVGGGSGRRRPRPRTTTRPTSAADRPAPEAIWADPRRHRPPLRRGLRRPQPHPPAQRLGQALRHAARDRARHVAEGPRARGAAARAAGALHRRGALQAPGPAPGARRVLH